MSTANRATFRSYILFWIGQKTSILGSSIVQFAIIWYITIVTQSAFILALASLFGFGTQVILTPVAGVYVDRWSRKLIIGIADFLQALATIVLIGLFMLGIASIWHIFALLTVRGVFQAFHSPAVSAILPAMVPQDRLSRMNSVNTLLDSVLSLIGPILGAVLLIFWQLAQVLWVDVITFLIPVIPLIIVTIPSVKKPEQIEEKPSFFKEFGEGFKIIKEARGILPFLMVVSLLNFLLMPVSTLLPFYVNIVHFGGASDLALIMAFLQGGIITGSIIMSLKKSFKRIRLVVTAVVYGIFVGYAIIALAPTGNFVVIGLGMMIAGICAPIVNITFATMFQIAIPLEYQGRVTAVNTALSVSISPLGMIYAGVLAEIIGVVPLFLLSVVLGVAVITASWFTTDIRYAFEWGQQKLQENQISPENSQG